MSWELRKITMMIGVLVLTSATAWAASGTEAQHSPKRDQEWQDFNFSDASDAYNSDADDEFHDALDAADWTTPKEDMLVSRGNRTPATQVPDEGQDDYNTSSSEEEEAVVRPRKGKQKRASGSPQRSKNHPTPLWERRELPKKPMPSSTPRRYRLPEATQKMPASDSPRRKSRQDYNSARRAHAVSVGAPEEVARKVFTEPTSEEAEVDEDPEEEPKPKIKRLADIAKKEGGVRSFILKGAVRRAFKVGEELRICAIDGGGTRGCVPARVIQEIEALAGKDIWKLFDVFGGASTGAIIAVALVAKIKGKKEPLMKIAEIMGMYLNRSGEIFGTLYEADKEKESWSSWLARMGNGGMHAAGACKDKSVEVIRTLYGSEEGQESWPQWRERKWDHATPHHVGQWVKSYVDVFRPKNVKAWAKERFKEWNPWGATKPKYSSQPRKKLFEDLLGDLTILDTYRDIVVPFYDAFTGEPIIYSTSGVEAGVLPNIRLVDLLMAATAAPSYFEAHDFWSIDGSRRFIGIDGGTFANNPALAAYMIARTYNPEEKKVRVMSIGTGAEGKPETPEEFKAMGLLKAASFMINEASSAGSEIVHMLLSRRVNKENSGRYLRLQPRFKDVPELDESDPEKLQRLVVGTEHYLQEEETETATKEFVKTLAAVKELDSVERFERFLQLERRVSVPQALPKKNNLTEESSDSDHHEGEQHLGVTVLDKVRTAALRAKHSVHLRKAAASSPRGIHNADLHAGNGSLLGRSTKRAVKRQSGCLTEAEFAPSPRRDVKPDGSNATGLPSTNTLALSEDEGSAVRLPRMAVRESMSSPMVNEQMRETASPKQKIECASPVLKRLSLQGEEAKQAFAPRRSFRIGLSPDRAYEDSRRRTSRSSAYKDQPLKRTSRSMRQTRSGLLDNEGQEDSPSSGSDIAAPTGLEGMGYINPPEPDEMAYDMQQLHAAMTDCGEYYGVPAHLPDGGDSDDGRNWETIQRAPSVVSAAASEDYGSEDCMY